MEEYRENAPSPSEALGVHIEDLQEKMSDAKLVRSGSTLKTDRLKRVEKVFEWKYLPEDKMGNSKKELLDLDKKDMQKINQNRIFKEAVMFVRLDRNGNVVHAIQKLKFLNIETFRLYYKMRLGFFMGLSSAGSSASCFNVDPLGKTTETQFLLHKDDIGDWKQVRRCEQAVWAGQHMGKPTRYTLGLDKVRKPEERTKSNKETRVVSEAVLFEEYLETKRKQIY